MPWEPGKSGNPLGRPGYEIEQAQLEKMRRILNKDLEIIEKFQDAEVLNELDEKKLAISQARVLKIYDKLHASKTDMTSDGKQITITIAKEIAEKHGINPNTSTSNDSQGFS